MKSPRYWGLLAFVLIAAMLRLVPHPANFSPVAAMALFGGAYFSRRWLAFAAPLAVLLLSDLVLGFHNLMWAVYGSFALTVMLGWLARETETRQVRWGRLGLATVTGSLLFFVITNAAVWWQGGMYPYTMDGLVSCFVAALPFLDQTMMGDGVYVVTMFGAWQLLERMVPALRSGALIRA